MNLTIQTRDDAIMAIKILEKGFDIKHEAVWEEENKVPVVTSPVNRKMLTELLCHLSTSNASLEKKWEKLVYSEKHSLVEKGCQIAKRAAAEGVKYAYYGNDEMALFSMFKAVGFC